MSCVEFCYLLNCLFSCCCCCSCSWAFWMFRNGLIYFTKYISRWSLRFVFPSHVHPSLYVSFGFSIELLGCSVATSHLICLVRPLLILAPKELKQLMYTCIRISQCTLFYFTANRKKKLCYLYLCTLYMKNRMKWTCNVESFSSASSDSI